MAYQLFERFSTGDVAGALDTLTDDVVWWIAGKKERTPLAGSFTKAQMAVLLTRMVGALEAGLKMTVVSCIGEADCASLEVVSAGDLKNGRRYRQEYHFLLGFRNGKIASVREYLDTQHTHDIWVAPATE